MATYRGMFLHDVTFSEIDAHLARGASIEDLAFDFQGGDDDPDSPGALSKYPGL